MNNQKTYDELLASEMNGNCYEHIWMAFLGMDYIVCKDYYLVEDNIVYMINDGKKQPSGDTLENTKNECNLIGIFNPDIKYEMKREYYSPEKLKQLLKLD